MSEVKFLGHIILAFGIKMDTEKIEMVAKFKELRNFKVVQQYSGFVNFYRRYIKGFAKVLASIIEFKKNTKWKSQKGAPKSFR